MSGAGSIASDASPPDQSGPRPGSGDGRTAAVRRQLLAHRAGDGREARSLARVLAELEHLDRPFDEDADPTHLTASAVVVGRRGVVLHRHRRLHRWMQPGGHIDPGETPAEAALRESVEETGLPLTPAGGSGLLHVDVHPAAAGHVHLDLRYLLWAEDAEPAPEPGESQEVAWFAWPEAEAIADEALVGALLAARRLVGAPEGRTDGASGDTTGEDGAEGPTASGRER